MVRKINCVGGYGDILFCEPIFRHFWKQDGRKPIVSIHTHQMWISQYIDSAEFSNTPHEEFITGSLIHNEEYINLRYANQIFRGYGPHDHHDLENMMLDKYRLLGLPEDLWKTLDINLVSKFQGEEFIKNIHDERLLNENSQVGKISISLEKNINYTVMREMKSYNLIDWWLPIFLVKENHHVSTSTFFLMQAIKNKFPEWNNPCYIYPRPNIDGLRGISQLVPDFNLIRVQ